MLQALRKAAGLPWGLKVDYLRVTLLFTFVEITLRMRGVSRTAVLLGVRPGDTEVPPEPSADPRDVLTPRELRATRVAYVVASHLYGASRGCLRRSLVIGFLLRRHSPQIYIGVGGTVGSVRAHAWLVFEHMRFEDSSGLSPLVFA